MSGTSIASIDSRGAAALLFFAAAAFVPALSAYGASESGTLGVTATVTHQCSVGDATLSMGSVPVVDGEGKISAVAGGSTVGIPWACTSGTSATLAFGPGVHSAGAQRRMKTAAGSESGHFLEYQLRAGSAAEAEIGASAIPLAAADGTNKVFTVSGGPSDSASNRTVKPADDYTDNVLMTITFAP